MLMKSAHVKLFKSVTDSGPVEFDDNVTCLVGKNESGKTTVLEALYRLNPLPMGYRKTFEGLLDYPRRIYNRDKEKVSSTVAIAATFALEADDIQAVEAKCGKGALNSPIIQVHRDYENKLGWRIDYNEKKLIEHEIAGSDLDPALGEDATTWSGLLATLRAQKDPPEAVRTFLSKFGDKDLRAEVQALLAERLPKFLYFDKYTVMPGRVSIHRLQHTNENQLKPDERTALSLLRLAGVDAADFTEIQYEARKASLEAAANRVTDEVFEFWSQNKDLSVELDVDFKTPPTDPIGQPPFLDVRIRNYRHRVTLNFGERSQGFMWFFSFLSAFSEFRERERMILLLDEPGLGLHAAAQADLLRFIDERLAQGHQVIYSTHSPFMVEATRLDRVRTVEDVDHEGTKVSADVLSTSTDTRFPLQAALGYELAQTLFLGPDNLIVEGPADYIYLQVISSHLRGLGRTGLDPRWVIVPVGGLDKIPTFVALLGAQLNVAVVLEVSAGATQKVNSLVQRGIIAGEKLIPLTEFTGTPEADIEDLFEVDFYLDLLGRSGIAAIKQGQLKTKGRILKRVEAVIGTSFDHYRPARYLLEHQVELLKKIDNGALDRFETLFKRANVLLAPVA
jgi:predicted ATPase